MIKLYSIRLAPNPTKIVLYLEERKALGAQFDIEILTVNTIKAEHKAQPHLSRNPFGTIPVLEIEPGVFIKESRAIVSYLERRYPAFPLFSEDLVTRAIQEDIERIVDVRLANLINNWVHVFNSPLGYEPNPERAKELQSTFNLAFDYLEELLTSDGRRFLCGDQPTLADCSLAASLQFARFVKAHLLADYPALQQWDLSYRAREPVQKIIKW